MTEIDLYVDEREESSFLEHERPCWPFIPSHCTVPCCHTSRKFSSFRDFREHWHERHNEFSSHYKCQACGRQFANNKHAKAHTKAKIHKGQTVTIKYVKEKNNGYINPGEYLPYQLGNKEDQKNTKTVQRQLAREKRQRELSDRKDDYSQIPSYGDDICRDERVVERQGQLYRDTNLWSKNKQKRVKLTPSNNFEC